MVCAHNFPLIDNDFILDHVRPKVKFEDASGLFKRQIYEIHHWVSEKHLQAYLNDMCYRNNRREMGDGEHVNDLLDRVSGRLTYKASIGA